MREPTRFRIGPIDYRIEWHDELWHHGEPLDGGHRGADATIDLRRNVDRQHMRRVLWHETIHAIMWMAGLEEHNEKMIDILATGILGVVKDNPWIASDLLDIGS